MMTGIVIGGWTLLAIACLGPCIVFAVLAAIAHRKAGWLAFTLCVGLLMAAAGFVVARPGSYARARMAMADAERILADRHTPPALPRAWTERDLKARDTATAHAEGVEADRRTLSRVERESEQTKRKHEAAIAQSRTERLHRGKVPPPAPPPPVIVHPREHSIEVWVGDGERAGESRLPAIRRVATHGLAITVLAAFLFVGYVFLDSGTRGQFTWPLRIVSLLAFIGVYAAFMAFTQ